MNKRQFLPLALLLSACASYHGEFINNLEKIRTESLQDTNKQACGKLMHFNTSQGYVSVFISNRQPKCQQDSVVFYGRPLFIDKDTYKNGTLAETDGSRFQIDSNLEKVMKEAAERVKRVKVYEEITPDDFTLKTFPEYL